MNSTTLQTAELQPSKLRIIVELMQSAGLLQCPRFFSCGHWQGDESGEYDPRERIIIKFEVYNPGSTNIELAFWSDGAIELRAHPNRHDSWTTDLILAGSYPKPVEGIEEMVKGSVEVIANTLNMYATSEPKNDYGPLVEAWKPLNAQLFDTGENLPEVSIGQAHERYWWQFWHNRS